MAVSVGIEGAPLGTGFIVNVSSGPRERGGWDSSLWILRRAAARDDTKALS